MPPPSPGRPISGGEHNMPFDHSPRFLRRAISMPLGITVPMVASGTRSPTAMLNAPQQICSASPSPASTSTSWMRSASGMRAQLEHPRHDDAVEPLPDELHLLDRRSERAERVADRRRIVGEIRRELAQPREEDLHQNCSRKRMSLEKRSRRSSTPWRSLAKRSMPNPKAKPCHSSGSRPQLVSTLGCTIPQPPSSM